MNASNVDEIMNNLNYINIKYMIYLLRPNDKFNVIRKRREDINIKNIYISFRKINYPLKIIQEIAD